MLKVCSNTLQQVEKIKYIGVLLTSDGRQNKEINIQIGEANRALCDGKFQPLQSFQFLNQSLF